jgi:hypothetical protein
MQGICQNEPNKSDRYLSHNEGWLFNETEKRCDVGTLKYHWLLKSPKKIHNYVYGVRFLLVSDANTLTHQLTLPRNELPGVELIYWMVWIWLFDFHVKFFSGRTITDPELLLHWPWSGWGLGASKWELSRVYNWSKFVGNAGRSRTGKIEGSEGRHSCCSVQTREDIQWEMIGDWCNSRKLSVAGRNDS